MIRIVASGDLDFEGRVQALCDRAATIPEEIETASRDVIRAVRARGDEAIRDLTWRFERRRIDHLEVPLEEWQDAPARVDPAVRSALEHAASRIRAFHDKERYQSFEMEEDTAGIRVGLRVSPLNRVGIYVPGGKALYPSTVLMTAIPAHCSGIIDEIIAQDASSVEVDGILMRVKHE